MNAAKEDGEMSWGISGAHSAEVSLQMQKQEERTGTRASARPSDGSGFNNLSHLQI